MNETQLVCTGLVPDSLYKKLLVLDFDMIWLETARKRTRWDGNVTRWPPFFYLFEFNRENLCSSEIEPFRAAPLQLAADRGTRCESRWHDLSLWTLLFVTPLSLSLPPAIELYGCACVSKYSDRTWTACPYSRNHHLSQRKRSSSFPTPAF